MKITNDRLAVAWAVQEHIEFLMGESFDLYPEEVIAAIPEPPDDSPATLSRVEGAIVATQAVIDGLLQRRADVARLTGHQSAEALLDARQEVLELDTAAIARDLGALSGQPEPLPAPDAQALRGQIESEVWEARKRIEAALHAEIAELRAQIVDVVFDGPPGPEGGRFVECEDADGVSINAGNWWQREDGYWALRIVRPPTRTVQAQNRDHDAEMFRRGWVAGQADALKQIDAARAEEREALRRVLCERCQKNL